MPEVTLESSAFSETIARTLGFLRSSLRTADNGDTGWYHYLDDYRPGVTASAVGLYCHRICGRPFEREAEVLRYLVGQQITQGEGKGGWSVRTTRGFPLVEATAWVLRAMSSGVSVLAVAQNLSDGVDWLQRQQNVDYGWGSYFGRPSRVFTTALSLLALQECGAPEEVIANGRKWLIDAQSPNEPGWGCMPNEPATLLHTGFALLALLGSRSALPSSTVRQSAEWLLHRLDPQSMVERSTIVEEYDIPYESDGEPVEFQNSLPHFATPVAISAMLEAGLDPLQPKLFDAVKRIMGAQLDNGAWELPRSPNRPSIWAIWPFLHALSTYQKALFPSSGSVVTIIFPGCAIVQSETAGQRRLTRRLLLRNALFDWIRTRRLPLALWLIGLIAAAIPLALFLAGKADGEEVLFVLVVPVLLLVFQLVWSHRPKGG